MMETERVETPAGGADGGVQDAEVIARIVGGEPALFELLMRRHNQRVYRTVRAILGRDDDCEDVMQQTYINAFQHLGQFRSDARFSTWLTRIAVNEAIQRGRRLGRRDEVALSEDDADVPATAAPDPEHAAYATELGNLLESVVDALPDSYRVVFVLREIEGLSIAETAESLDLNRDTVKTRLHRAKAHLRSQIEQRLGTSSPVVYGFHLSRCDRLVSSVLTQLGI